MSQISGLQKGPQLSTYLLNYGDSNNIFILYITFSTFYLKLILFNY